MKRASFLASAVVLCAAAPGVAHADTVDGNWCNEQGRQLSIEGSTILTPDGHRIEGRYARHNFSYTTPDGEPEAGAPVSMQLVNETTIRATTGQSPIVVIWRRCEQVS